MRLTFEFRHKDQGDPPNGFTFVLLGVPLPGKGAYALRVDTQGGYNESTVLAHIDIDLPFWARLKLALNLLLG